MTERPVWLRLENESSSAYEAFTEYLSLPPRERSIDRAAKTLQRDGKNTPRHWTVWSSRFNWVERVQAYDDHITASRFLAEEEAVISRARQKVLEREDIEKIEREIGNALFEKAREMLKWSHVRKTVQERYQDGREKSITLEPKKWTAQSITRFIEVADKLRRLSAGMHTDSTRVDVNTVLDDSMTFVLNAAAKVLPPEWYKELLNALHPESTIQNS